MFGFSAPGESPLPPQRNTRGAASDIRRDVIYEVQNIRRDVVSEIQTAVSDILHTLGNQGVADGQHQSVSVTHLPSVAEYTLTIVQAQNRSAISTTERSNVLHSHLVYSGSCHLRHQGSSLDATS